MCAYENHHFHIIISLNISLPYEDASPGLSVLCFWFRSCWENTGANMIWAYSSYEVDPL